MEKIFNKKLLAFAIIFAIFMPVITYALGAQSQENGQEQKFFYSNKLEATPGDVITMSIDLSKINYEDFEFSLTSSNGVSNVSTEDDDIEVDIDENEFKIISNKSNFSMNKIDLYYQIPENAQINSTITFVGTIKEIITSDDLLEDATEVLSEEVKIIITIVKEEKDDNQLSEDNKDKENEITDEDKSKEISTLDDKFTTNNSNVDISQISMQKQVSSGSSQMSGSTITQSSSKTLTSSGGSIRRNCYL